MTNTQFEQLLNVNKDHIILVELKEGSYWLRNINDELLEIDENQQLHFKEVSVHQLTVFKPVTIEWYD